MKLSSCLLAFSVLFAGADAKKSPRSQARLMEVRNRRRLNRDFMAAMHADDKIKAGRRKAKHQKERLGRLHDNLVKHSRKLAEGEYNQYQNNGQYQYQNNGQQQYQNDGQQQYQNNGQQQYQNNGQQQYQNNGQQQYQNDGQQQYQNDGQQQYQDADGQWVYGQNQYGYDMNVAFDMTARAFKYSGCAAIKAFDSDLAEENGNPMTVDTYAVFRLCPAESCNKYSLTGCGKNYGEYAVEMQTYLGYILEYYEDRYEEYCEYCLPCDYDTQVEAKMALQECYEDMNQQEWAENQETQQQAWQDYYAANGGDMSGYNAGDQQYNAYNNGNGFNSYNQYYNGAYHGQNSYNGGNTNYNNAQNGNGYNWYGNSASSQNNGYQNDGNKNGNSYYNANNQAQGNSNNAQNYQAQDSSYYQDNSNYANNNGARKLEDDQNNNQNNGQNQNYGYYDENGDWVEGEDADEDQQNGWGYWGADGIWYPYEEDGDYETQMVECDDGSMCDECEYENEQEYLACDDYICSDYYTYCSDWYTDQESQFDIYNYLECQPYENENGQTFYIAPHCASNHYTISLGVFSDENCANYIGETVSLSQVLGYQYKDEDLFQIPKDCISCDGTEDYEEQQQENQGEGRYGDGTYVTQPDTDEDGVVAMCSALYESSAQCNKHMNNYEAMSLYMTAYEIALETRYCSFIENIVYGSFDEQGDITLKGEQFDFSDWRNPEQYKKIKMPAGQAIGVALSVVLVVALAATAIFTQRSLVRQSTPWRPKKVSDPNSLSRQNSGIVMGRSRSGPGAAPLI